MDAKARSSRWPRDAVEQPNPTQGRTTTLLASVATPASVEDARGCVVSARPTCNEVLASYQDAICRYVHHLTGNRVAAAEVYQETVLTAYHEFDGLNGDANHHAWLYQIATNAFLRHRRRRSKTGLLAQESTEPVPTASNTDQPAGAALLREIEAFVANLPPSQRLALVQRRYHDLSYAEIAAILRCSEATARTRVYQALRTLRDHFGERL